MKEGTPGGVRRFIHTAAEALSTGGVSLLIDKSRERRRPYRPWNKNTLEIKFSPEDDAAYIRMNYGKVARTDVVKDGLHIDYDADGDVVGIELVGFNLKRAKEKNVPQSTESPKI